MASKVLYCPDTGSVDDILQFFHQNHCQVAISAPKLSSLDLFKAMDENYILPPHSTYFTPKIPNDLFVQKLHFPITDKTEIAI